MSEFHSLANLIKRLEVATTRLEDLAMSGSSASAVAASSPREAPASAQSQGSKTEADLVVKFDQAIKEVNDKFMSLSAKIGDVVAVQADKFKQAMDAQRDIIRISCMCQKPPMNAKYFMDLVQPLQTVATEIEELTKSNRNSALFNHLSTVSSGIGALGWFTCDTPVSFVGEMRDSAMFYANRVKRDYKDKDETHVQWVDTYIALLRHLEAFVKEQCPTGLPWNPKGESLEHLNADSTSLHSTVPSGDTPPSSAGAPPPPPPPPPPPAVASDSGSAPTLTGAAAVFAEINQGGEGVTAGLRKVDKSEMTHKNPSLRAGNVVSTPKKQGPPTPDKPNKYVLKKPAKTELDGTKWIIEYHENNPEIVLEETAINHAVYIYRCTGTHVRIKGKVNAITMDSCTKCSVALDSTVSTVDIVNCKSFGVQIFHVTPTIAVDKSESGQIYLSGECLNAEILSSKSTSLNILIPEKTQSEDADFVELAVPEMFKTTIVNGKLVTNAVEHTG